MGMIFDVNLHSARPTGFADDQLTSIESQMIALRGITKKFDSLQVLKGIDLDIARGEVVSIVGPSGAGKTTLLQIMGSLERPDSGSVAYDGEEIFLLNDNKLARFRDRKSVV